MKKIDPITLEVLRNAFINIAREMRTTIIKTAHSSTVQEACDFSVSIFEKENMVSQAGGLASHLGALPFRIKKLFEKFPPGDLNNGDIIIFNDPYTGGSHTSDVTICKAVFLNKLLFIPITLAHWSDVGGMTPGSISGSATDLFQEGLLIPPIKLYEKGKLNKSVYDMILNNVRLPEERGGDIRAQIAACNIAEDRLKTLVKKYGGGIIKRGIDLILDTTEARIRAIISKLPDGIYEYEDYIDSDGYSTEPYRIKVKVEIRNDEIMVDFDGTSEQAIGPTNAPLASLQAGVFLTLKSILDPDWPSNQGFYRPVEIKSPPGTIVNPERPAPTGSVWEVAVRVKDAMIGALSNVVPERIGAPSFGATNHTFIGGIHPETKKPYLWYEYPAGGRGGTSIVDGCDALGKITSGDTKDLAIERVEAENPLICVLYENLKDSGGPGKFRGGLGLRRDMKVEDDCRYKKIGLSCIWDRSKIPPFGLNGGFSGYPQRVAVLRKNGREEYVSVELGTKVTLLPLEKGDIVSMRTGGGGGYGDPLDRDPNKVLDDFKEEYISEYTAKEIYGIIIDRSNWIVDKEATIEYRKIIKNSRVYCKPILKDKEEFLGRRRAIRLNTIMLRKININEGDLVELLGKSLAPLRVWVIKDDSYPEESIGIDAVGMRILRINEEEKVWVRNPFWMGKI